MSPQDESGPPLLGKNSEKDEAVQIFKSIQEVSQQALNITRDLNEKVKGGGLDVADGIDLLDVKNQVMVQYLLNLVQVIVMKTTGKELKGHPVIDRLIESRVVLERTKPIEQKLSYQIEKYLKIFSSGKLDENDPGRFKANISDLMANESDREESDSDEEAGEGSKDSKKPAVYVPPKLTSVTYDGDGSAVDKEKKLYERARKQALRSSVIQELKEEYLDTPVEIRATNSLQHKEDKFSKMKKEFEESYFTRLPVTKEERKRKRLKFSLGALGDSITAFEDTSILEGGPSNFNKTKKRKIIKSKKGKMKKRRKQ